MTPEGKVKAKVNKILKAHGENIYSYMPVKSRFGAKTIDYLICAYGCYIGIETKAPDKNPTALQHEHIRRIVASGGTVFVIDGDTTELENFLASASQRQTQNAGRAYVGANNELVSGRPNYGGVNISAARTRRQLPAA
jgi:hypothetical protein